MIMIPLVLLLVSLLLPHIVFYSIRGWNIDESKLKLVSLWIRIPLIIFFCITGILGKLFFDEFTKFVFIGESANEIWKWSIIAGLMGGLKGILFVLPAARFIWLKKVDKSIKINTADFLIEEKISENKVNDDSDHLRFMPVGLCEFSQSEDKIIEKDKNVLENQCCDNLNKNINKSKKNNAFALSIIFILLVFFMSFSEKYNDNKSTSKNISQSTRRFASFDDIMNKSEYAFKISDEQINIAADGIVEQLKKEYKDSNIVLRPFEIEKLHIDTVVFLKKIDMVKLFKEEKNQFLKNLDMSESEFVDKINNLKNMDDTKKFNQKLQYAAFNVGKNMLSNKTISNDFSVLIDNFEKWRKSNRNIGN